MGAFCGHALFTPRVLLPTDDLAAYSPWREEAAQLGVTRPNNPLAADVVLQNVAWRRFVQESWRRGEPPLWNPSVLGGQAFLAAGQNQPLYPLAQALLFLPVPQWYEWFLSLHLLLAMAFTHLFLRELGASRAGRLLGAVAFGLCGFFAVSTMWPQMIATGVWMPLLFWAVERTIRRGQEGGWVGAPGQPDPAAGPRPRRRALAPPLLALSGVVALQFLAGHPEISFYNLAAAGVYALGRLAQLGPSRGSRPSSPASAPETDAAGPPGSHGNPGPGFLGRVVLGGLLLAAVALGTLIAAAQLVPFREVSAANFRIGQASYEEVRGYALPPEGLLAFVLPNVFGNPTHHEVFDLTQLRWVAAGRADGPRALSRCSDQPAGVGPTPSCAPPEPRLAVAGDAAPATSPSSIEGEARTAASTEWGKKNFVEGTGYIGIAPLALAALALGLSRAPQRWPLAALALISLLLAFGTPLLAPLFFLVPGYSQLHTPFRWVFPFGFAVAALAGLGLTALEATGRPLAGRLGSWLLGAAGGLALGLGLALAVRAPVLALAERALASIDRLGRAFPDAAALFSYQWANLAALTLLLAATGLGLRLIRAHWLGAYALPLVTALDLIAFGAGYSTAGDPAILDYVPAPIQAIRADAARSGFGPFRVTAFGADVLPANTAALFGLEDIRGYDSLIPADYVEYLSRLEPDNVRGMLQFSKIEALHDPRSLTSPQLDALGVRYVLTRERLELPGLTLIHEGPTRVYRRETALPRALVVDPTAAAAFRPLGQARIERSEPNQVRIRTSQPADGLLVLFDRFDPGWTATVDGERRPVWPAGEIFRGVATPAGEHEVVFTYQPTSWRIGLLLSVAGLLALLGLAAVWAGQDFLVRATARSALARVVKNALLPMAAGVVNKLLDLGLAIVMLRFLGPTDIGRYTWAVLVVGYFDILVNFGLGVLLTRDLAREPAAANRYLGAAVGVRAGLAALTFLVALAIAGPLAGPLDLTPEMGLVVALLTIGIAVSNLTGLATALFNARELMEYPAYVATLTTILKVVGGVLALTLGYGIVGLAAVSIVVNLVTGLVMIGLLLEVVGRPAPTFDFHLARQLMAAAYPLMLNNLLNTVFFRIDGLVLRALWGDTVLGWYGAAYKFLDGLNLIPSQLTLALFPVLAKSVGDQRQGLVGTVELGLKALLTLAFPLAIGITVLAEPLVRIVAGDAYVPHSVVALQLLIWFLPFSFVNGLLQYVLIAVDQQRFITGSFLLAAGFNLGANLLIIPHWSYVGAAATTIASELVLLGPFWYATQRHVGPVRLLPLAWRPALAAGPMAAVTWALLGWPLVVNIGLSALAYTGLLFALGGVAREERAMLRGAWAAVRGRPAGV